MTRSTSEVPDDVAGTSERRRDRAARREVAAAAAMRLHHRDARPGTETQDVDMTRSAADDLGGVGR